MAYGFVRLTEDDSRRNDRHERADRGLPRFRGDGTVTEPHAVRARVSHFGGPEVLRFETFTPGRPRRGKVRVRVTHASVGSTDAMARAGNYLLQPRSGFVPGYDFVGVLVHVNAAAARRGLDVGMRVVGCLARMGSNATQLDVPADRVIPLPDALDSTSAAALPLDLVTAALALELAAPPRGGTLFVQGVSGSVGSIVTQRATAKGLRVVGTASERTRATAESLGATVADYRDPNWPALVQNLAVGGIDASIDHTGSPLVRAVTLPGGTVVRTAWSGRPGHGRRDAALGGAAVLARTFASPRERLCSVPLLVALQPAKYRRILQDELDRVIDGSLRGPVVSALPFSDVVEAHRRLDSLAPGHKLVLKMASD
ncbi:zinc-binding dehydrogenase [Mycobacterium sp. 050128]|uniref:quinone oxidoreductase family protein n=1 Tax=Mycobacterium sp. 050128 TaxID=3096112 RepID=UPI002EDA3B4A